MKLLYCGLCQDIFKLDSVLKTCKCKKSSGQYITINTAEIKGKYAIPLCIGWTSFNKAIENRPFDEKENLKAPAYFNSWIPPKMCDSITHLD